MSAARPSKGFRFHVSLRVRWSEGDAQGIVYNGAYLDYIEVAQVEYFRNLGMSLYDEEQRRHFDTATVKATLEYRAPARIDDMLEVYTRVAEIGNTSFTMETEIYRDGSDELLTRAEIVYVDYDAATGQARPVPEGVRSLIQHYERTGEVLPSPPFPS